MNIEENGGDAAGVPIFNVSNPNIVSKVCGNKKVDARKCNGRNNAFNIKNHNKGAAKTTKVLEGLKKKRS